MTTAKLLTAPGKGHGLTDAITDPMYRSLTRNENPGDVVAVVILRPKSFGATDTADGRHQHVAFEVAKCEPVLDVDQANELRYLIQALYEQRTSTGEQQRLPIALGKEDEKRLALMERIEDWATAQNVSGGQLEALWRENFGAGTDDDWSFGDQGVPGDYRKATSAHLLSFAYSQGVLSTETPLPHEDREDDEPEADDESGDQADGDASTSVPSDEEPKADTADVGVACQVCGKKTTALFDGLCEDDARNAGIRTDPDNVHFLAAGDSA